MQIFHPRKTDAQAPLRWWRQSVALLARKPLEWALVFAAQFVAAGFVAILPDLPAVTIALALNLLLIYAGTRLAASADGRPEFNRTGFYRNLAAIAFIGVAVVLLEVGLTNLLIPAKIQDAAGDLLLPGMAPGFAGAIQLGLPLTWCLWLALMSCGLAFVPSLLFANPHAVGVRTSCVLSLAATGRNLYAYILGISLVNLMLAIVPFGAVGAPIMAVVSYVAFRDIFLGISENAAQERAYHRVATAAGH